MQKDTFRRRVEIRVFEHATVLDWQHDTLLQLYYHIIQSCDILPAHTYIFWNHQMSCNNHFIFRKVGRNSFL